MHKVNANEADCETGREKDVSKRHVTLMDIKLISHVMAAKKFRIHLKPFPRSFSSWMLIN
jgi:hypothetical protein